MAIGDIIKLALALAVLLVVGVVLVWLAGGGY